MTTYYKATRPDGTDCHTGTIDYGAALVSGDIVRHPAEGMVRDDASTYLSVSTEPADCTGFRWPCRLFRVEPVGKTMTATDLPNKRACSALRVVEELPAWQAFGPNGQAVVAIIDRAGRLTDDEARRLAAARVAAGEAAWWAVAQALDAARVAAREAARDAAWDATWAATLAELVRDLITPEQYDLLMGPWRSVVG
jgi:hypothetical protein